jgi:hypothetical protein
MKLSGKLANMILKNQKMLGVTKMDVLCVSIAGLCHDLGHGECFNRLRNNIFLLN